MPKQITIIQGHPDAADGHFCHALAQAYAGGARAAGHEVVEIQIARLSFDILRSREEWMDPTTISDDVRAAQDAIGAAHNLFIVYPLWLGTMPALLKAFLVLCQGNIDGFSWFVGVQGQAPLAANGYSLRKSGNTAMDADGPTRRASLWCPAAAMRCLTRGCPLPAHRALRQNTTGTLNPSILP